VDEGLPFDIRMIPTTKGRSAGRNFQSDVMSMMDSFKKVKIENVLTAEFSVTRTSYICKNYSIKTSICQYIYLKNLSKQRFLCF
jgi:hypothetical protein